MLKNCELYFSNIKIYNVHEQRTLFKKENPTFRSWDPSSDLFQIMSEQLIGYNTCWNHSSDATNKNVCSCKWHTPNHCKRNKIIYFFFCRRSPANTFFNRDPNLFHGLISSHGYQLFAALLDFYTNIPTGICRRGSRQFICSPKWDRSARLLTDRFECHKMKSFQWKPLGSPKISSIKNFPTSYIAAGSS